MIKINLLGKGMSTPTTGRSAITNFTQSLMSPREASKGHLDVAMKLIVALGPLIACVGTEQWMVGNKQQDLDRVRGELTAKQAEIEAKKKDVEQVQRFKADKAQLDIRMNTIRNLSKARLKNVKALDAIQNIIPTKAWLMGLKLDESKVDLRGRAMEDNDISSFMKGLEENIFFSQVLLISSSSAKTEDGVVKEFNIAASVENL